ncbi:unnamed protein product [Chrysoparadoxa australica]
MLVALKVSNVKASAAWYTSKLGMRQLPYPKVRPGGDSVFEPEQPKGSVFMGYNTWGCGVLLIPAKGRETIEVSE